MGVVKNMKEVADLVKRFNDLDLNRRILTLENEVMDLSREKRRAEERIEELERTLRIKTRISLSRELLLS
jgi:predicted  nucleic acid-binding Zn-ribbon protein